MMASLQDLLSEKEILHIIKQATGSQEGKVIAHQLRPAADGLSGFLGDHFKLTLHVKQDESVKILNLFVKCMPLNNEAKAKFIDEANFYKREALVYELLEQMGGDDASAEPWHAAAYLYSSRALVMPDLSPQGYAPQPQRAPLPLPHLLRTAASVARFHAAFANYSVSRAPNGHRFYNFLDDHELVLEDTSFCDSVWFRGGGKVSAEVLKTFSKKYKAFSNLEERLIDLYLKTCDDLQIFEDTVNVLLHRDLWANNILFKHDNNGTPVAALLIDFQCLRYGPPAFDLAVFLYMTCLRDFRELHEREILDHYFEIFWESLNEATKTRLKEVNYCFEEFLKWYEKARRFGMLVAVMILPFTLMDPVFAKQKFDDPETFDQHMLGDRSIPVIEHCRQCPQYMEKLLQLFEEFAERFLEYNTN